jgi:protein-S-isoprenylcysteine O-methyltransferase Ste14
MLWLRSAVFTVLLPGTVLVGVPLWLSGGDGEADPAELGIGSLRWVGLPLVVLGAAGLLWCIADFARRGRGTLAPVDPPKFVVRSGLYRITRNPMYVAVVTTLLGEALLFDSVPIAVWAAVVAVTVHLFVVLYEEPTLHRQFGEPYDDYRAAVPRWIGPRRAVTPVTPRRGT